MYLTFLTQRHSSTSPPPFTDSLFGNAAGVPSALPRFSLAAMDGPAPFAPLSFSPPLAGFTHSPPHSFPPASYATTTGCGDVVESLQYQLACTPPASPTRNLLDDQLRHAFGSSPPALLRHAHTDSDLLDPLRLGRSPPPGRDQSATAEQSFEAVRSDPSPPFLIELIDPSAGLLCACPCARWLTTLFAFLACVVL